MTKRAEPFTLEEYEAIGWLNDLALSNSGEAGAERLKEIQHAKHALSMIDKLIDAQEYPDGYFARHFVELHAERLRSGND